MRESHHAAFSLTELLAFITVCGLLLCIAAPSLSAARSRSRQAVCLDRMGTIGQASRIYAADDEHGLSIPVNFKFGQGDNGVSRFVGAYEWGGKSGIGRPGWANGPSTGFYAWISSKYGTRAGFGPVQRPLNEILYPTGFRDNLFPLYNRFGADADRRMDLPAYRCPSDDGPPAGAHCPDWLDHPDRSSYDQFGTSFAANMFMAIYSGGGSPMFSFSPYLRPMSRVPNPARTFAYEENIGRFAWFCRRAFQGCSSGLGPGADPGPTGAVRGWHGKNWTYSYAFVDGHAGRNTLYIEGTEDSQGFAYHYRNELELVFPDNSNAQQFYCVVSARGDGWQKDTLPSPGIDTGVYLPVGNNTFGEDCVNIHPSNNLQAPGMRNLETVRWSD